jgi:hypothetical protein
MKKFLIFFSVLFYFASGQSFGQITDYELGSKFRGGQYQQTGFYDLSDPESVNIRVAVWGFVRYPGKYLVPSYTSVLDLLSFAGGPGNESQLDDIRIYRNKSDGSQEMIKYDFNDILWESKLDSKFREIPILEAGDILVVPGSPRYFTRDDVSFWTSILSALITITILILNLVKN